MRRPVLLPALLATGLLAAIVAQPSFGDQRLQTQQTRVQHVQASARNDTPSSRMEGERALRDAMAGAVIGTIASQFGETEVEIKLDALRSEQINLIDNSISGEGRIRLGESDTWIPLTFQGLYDTTTASVSAPQLQLGGKAVAAHALAPKAPLGRELEAEVIQRLQSEFGNQPVDFALHNTDLQQLDAHRSRLFATGVTDFGDEGTVATAVEAVYDQRQGKWLQVAYTLGEEIAG